MADPPHKPGASVDPRTLHHRSKFYPEEE